MIETFTILSAVISFLSIFNLIKSKIIVFWLLVILLIIFNGLRWEMGTDWDNYYKIFMEANTYMKLGKPPGLEAGYIYYNTIIRLFTDNYSYFLLITTAFIYIGIFYAVAKITNYNLLSLFYIFSTLTWYSGSLRQMMACVFFVFAIKAVIERKLYVFIACIIIGALFHNSIIIFIFTYILYGLGTTTLLLIYVFLIFISVFSGKLIYIIDYILSFYTDRSYKLYVGGTLSQSNPVLGMTRKLLTTLGIFLFTYPVVFIKKIDLNRWLKIKFLLFIVTLSPLLYYIGTYHVDNISSRLDIYVSILSLGILVGVLDDTMTKKVNRVLLFFFVVVLSSIFYYRLGWMSLFHPYSSVFYNFELNRALF